MSAGAQPGMEGGGGGGATTNDGPDVGGEDDGPKIEEID